MRVNTALPAEQQRQRYSVLINRALPRINRAVLQCVCKFLHKVQLHSAYNKMTADNLSIVFAPNVLGAVREPADKAPPTPASSSAAIHTLIGMGQELHIVMKTLIGDYGEIFGDS